MTLLVFTVAAFGGAAAHIARIFRAPDINALVFFGCWMLTDPPTSPARPGDQVWFGALAAAIGATLFLLFGVQWFVLAGLPIANAGESLRRLRSGRGIRQADGRRGVGIAETVHSANRQ